MPTDTIIGVTYMLMGTFGFLENILTAYLMATDPHMRNPTYFYMINLCVADGLILIPLVIYSGLTLIWPMLAHPAVVRVASFMVPTVWYVQCLLLVLTCLSRYVQLEWTHKVQVYFNRKILIGSICLVWLIPMGVFSNIFWTPDICFKFFSELYMWEFDRKTPIGDVFYVENLCFDIVIAILINVFNFLSLMNIRRRRKQIQIIDSSTNFKREIKLFVQCAITGCIFTTACAFFVVMSFVADPNYWYEYLMSQVLWTVHHIQNPIIYFCLNARLRRRCLGLVRTSGSGAAGRVAPG